MKREWIASTVFNLAFFCVTATLCIAYIPLLLLPREWFVSAVKFWIRVITALEKNILGLTYEVRGAENLPKTGSYLIAAKHQSAYETFKLHLLFDNPAIILKKELLRIPIWGMYLKKSDVIAIDRSTPEKALKSIEDGAVRVTEQGRPIVIFPQGTRVRPEQTTMDKPYKPGIARIQETTGLPIVPLTLNSGAFWPRSGWLKSSGTVVFEFLEPIEPGKDRKALMKELEKKIEGESSRLMNEAQISAAEGIKTRKPALAFLIAALILFGGYSALWFKVAEEVKNSYITQIQKVATIKNTGIPVISGYPGKINLDVLQQIIHTDEGSLKVQVIHAESWPFLFSPVALIKGLLSKMEFDSIQHSVRTDEAVLNVEKIHNKSWSSLLSPVEITTGPVTVKHFRWKNPLILDGTKARFTYKDSVVNIKYSAVRQGDFTASLTGRVDLKQKPVAVIDVNVAIQNHQILLNNLAENGIIEPRIALFTGAGFAALSDADGVVRVPITQRGRTLYAGPLPVASLPE